MNFIVKYALWSIAMLAFGGAVALVWVLSWPGISSGNEAAHVYSALAVGLIAGGLVPLVFIICRTLWLRSNGGKALVLAFSAALALLLVHLENSREQAITAARVAAAESEMTRNWRSAEAVGNYFLSFETVLKAATKTEEITLSLPILQAAGFISPNDAGIRFSTARVKLAADDTLEGALFRADGKQFAFVRCGGGIVTVSANSISHGCAITLLTDHSAHTAGTEG